jgi:drug/metabolite transporter (DMT)-like permease
VSADLALIAVAALWGVSFSVTAALLPAVPPHVLLALRFALATAALAVLRPRALLGAGAAAWRAGAVLGLCLYTGFAFQTFGLAHTTPARSAFLTASYVFLVPLLGFAFGRERVGAAVAGGALLASVGLALLTGPDVSAEVRRGDLLSALCALGFALHLIGLGRYAGRIPSDVLAATQLAVVTVLALAASLAFEPPRLALPAAAWAGIAYLALGCTTLAYAVQTWAQRTTPPARAALIFALEPAFAALVSVGLGREWLEPREALGGALIVAGVALGEALRAPAVPSPGEVSGPDRLL